MKPFFKKHLFTLVLMVGVVAYIYVAGSSGSCSACSAVTGMFTGN